MNRLRTLAATLFALGLQAAAFAAAVDAAPYRPGIPSIDAQGAGCFARKVDGPEVKVIICR